MKLRNLRDISIFGKTILYRAPYDIDVIEENGKLKVSDDLRIRATIPTLEFLLSQNCKIVILFYVGRPDGKVVKKLQTNPQAEKLSELLRRPVKKVDDCIGNTVFEKIKAMKTGEIIMLENVRFHPEEMLDDDNFAKELCKGKDLIVFDGFPQAHRKHASTTGIEQHLPAVAGFYLAEEVETLTNLLSQPEHPFTMIIGGAKISDKVAAVQNMLKIADQVLVGGAVANVFLKASGKKLGDSFMEDIFVDKVKKEKKDWEEVAKSILALASSLGKEITCPVDLVASDGKENKVVEITKEAVPENWAALDIGPETRRIFSDIIEKSKTVFINGPVGKFENENFSKGSKAILEAMKKVAGTTIIAGGDTINLVRKYGNLQAYTHISLAGGATLEFLAGEDLPALKMLE
jgi:phosphoglycerate kinase